MSASRSSIGGAAEVAINPFHAGHRVGILCREAKDLWQARELVRELELQQQLFEPRTIAGEG